MILTPALLLPKRASRSGRGPGNARVPVAESPCASDMPMLPFPTLPLCTKEIDMQELLALLRNGLHGLLVNTIQTMEETGRTVCDVTNTGPWECTMELAHQVWDTSRHVEIFLQLLERVEGYGGEYPETTAETSSAGLAGDAMLQLIELAKKVGDPVI